MSRPNTNSSPEPRERYSWISLPDSECFDDDTRHEQSVQSSTVGSVSRPESQILGQYEPVSRIDTSPHAIHEQETLLDTSYDRAGPPVIPLNAVDGCDSLDQQCIRTPDNTQKHEPSDHQDQNLQKSTEWLPYTLRRPYLTALGTVSLVLSIVLATLCWQSYKNHGLGDEVGSTGLFFGWRYTPTIAAVFFTQAIVQIAEDVKRTEAYARMTSPETVKAKFTLFYSPRVWWKSIFIGFSRKRSGGYRGWALALSSLAAGVSILGISAFSSSLLVAKDVLTKESVQLQRYAAGQTTGKELLPIQLVPRRDTYSRTISGYLFNVSTSMWMFDSYLIVPFGASNSGIDRVSLENGIWQAETEVFHLDYHCTPMVLSDKSILDISYTAANVSQSNDACPNDVCTVKSKGLQIRSQDGCEVRIQGPIDVWDGVLVMTDEFFQSDTFSTDGGLLWTNMSSDYVSWQTLVDEYGQTPEILASGNMVLEQWSRTFIHSLSEQCVGRDLLLVSPPWIDYTEGELASWENLTVRSAVCTPQYNAAAMPVTVSTGGAGTSISFDVSEFERRSLSVPKKAIDFALLDDISFHNSNWAKYITIPLTVHGDFEGISTLLVDKFGQNVSSMLESDTLEMEASMLRTRFAKELLLSSITESDVLELESAPGSVTHVRGRILVVTEIGITLSVLFLLLACYLTSMIFSVSVRRRPLGLRSDPAAIIGTASLLKIDSPPMATLQTLAGHSRPHIQETIESRTYNLRGSILSEGTSKCEAVKAEGSDLLARKKELFPGSPKSKASIGNDWRPSMLHKRWLFALLAYLFATTVAILILRGYAREKKLSRTAFTYEVDVGLFNTTFSPHSLIATLIAVGIGLSWDGVDKPMRGLQPYLSMSRNPVAPKRGASLTYQSSYWVWAAVKAALRKHWILCLVAAGTTLSQILIISMAAVFERQAVTQEQPIIDADNTITAPFSLRQEPLNFYQSDDGTRERHFEITESLLEASKIQWLYNALDEIILDPPQLPWTKDEWVFTPLDIDPLPNVTMSSKATSEDENHSNSDPLSSPANISSITSALRSRLECSPIVVPNSSWLNRAADVYPDRTNETLPGFALPTTLFNGELYNTSVFSIPRRLSCCANGTDPGGQAVVAYWTSNSSMLEPEDPADLSQNCTTTVTENTTETRCESFSRPSSGPENVVVHGSWYRNFTIKWIVGPGATAEISGAELNTTYQNNGDTFGNASEELLYFTEEPTMSIMNCAPIIEVANASVIVARSSGNVLDFVLLSDTQPDQNAWEYAWDIMYPEPTRNDADGNVSYGHLFMTQLLTAPYVIAPRRAHSWLSYNKSIEETESERFNIRDRDRGLNVDFMSYANWHLANKNSDALLNTTTLFWHSEKTLQTFFKHFAHSGSSQLGGYRSADDSGRAVYKNALDWQDGVINATFTERFEVLVMNEVATWISLTILILLIIILIVLIVSLQIVYPSSSLQHPIECLADVLTMVAGSDGLISLIEEQGVEGFANSDKMTRLGWFKDRKGDVRWGVELVDAEGIEWVDGPEAARPDEVGDEESSVGSIGVADTNSSFLEGERRPLSPQYSAQEQEAESMLGRQSHST